MTVSVSFSAVDLRAVVGEAREQFDARSLARALVDDSYRLAPTSSQTLARTLRTKYDIAKARGIDVRGGEELVTTLEQFPEATVLGLAVVYDGEGILAVFNERADALVGVSFTEVSGGAAESDTTAGSPGEALVAAHWSSSRRIDVSELVARLASANITVAPAARGWLAQNDRLWLNVDGHNVWVDCRTAVTALVREDETHAVSVRALESGYLPVGWIVNVPLFVDRQGAPWFGIDNDLVLAGADLEELIELRIAAAA